jgi:hypothetical protein
MLVLFIYPKKTCKKPRFILMMQIKISKVIKIIQKLMFFFFVERRRRGKRELLEFNSFKSTNGMSIDNFVGKY